MLCPGCGEKMEKGCITLLKSRFDIPHLDWYSDRSAEKYSKFPDSLFSKADKRIYTCKTETGDYGFSAYRCPKCGMIVIPPSMSDKDYDKIL